MANRYTFSNSRNLNGAHLGFTSGLQADLNALITAGGAVEGTFYLTTDTHRLYIGREVTADTQDTSDSFTTKTIPIPVNEGIQTVDSVGGLPSNANAGEFYYVSGSNILAVYNGNQWVQINPNTNTDTEVSSASIGSGITEYQLTTDSNIVDGKTYYVRSGNEGSYTYTAVNNPTVASISTYYEPYRIKYTLTVNQTTYDKTTNQTVVSPQPVTADFYIRSSDLAGVLSISAGLSRGAVSNNASEIALDGGISNGHTVILKGGTNVSLSTSETDTITINGPTYNLSRGTLNNNSIPVSLQLNNAAVDTISVTAGNHLTLDSTDTTGITIKHNAPGAATQTNGTDDEYGTNSSSVNLNGANQSSIKIPTIKVDAYGHVTAIEDTDVALNGIKEIQTSATDGKISFIAQNNQSVAESSAHALSYEITVDGNTTTVDNKGNLGSFYSAEGVDARIERAMQGANALVYKGVVGNQGGGAILTLPTENVQIGDTYLVAAGVTKIYTKTTDTTIVNGKTYYTVSGGAFSEVASPSAASLSNYYEKVEDVESGDLFIATGDEYTETQDTTVNTLKNYYTRTGSSYPYTYTKVTPATGSNPASLNYYENAGVIQENLTWTYVPSGDDTDTQYNLTVNNKTITLHNSTTNADVNSIQFIAGNKITPANITTEGSTYKVQLNHDAMTGLTDDTTYGAGQNNGTTSTLDGNNQNQFSVPSFTVDGYGHIKSASTLTYTLPTATSYKLINNTSQDGSGTYGTTLTLFKDTSNAGGQITLSGDSTGGVSVAASSTPGIIEIKHRQLASAAANNDSLTNYTTSSSATTITDNFTALTALNIDNYGHVSQYKVTKFKLPNYTMSSSLNNNKATLTLQKDNADVANKFSITSNNLTITNSSDTNEQIYTVNLEWGSFTSNT